MSESPRSKKAPPMPLVAALPAVPHVGLVDLLRAADAAVVAGEMHRARQLLAAAMEHAERVDQAPGKRRRDG
jgi:hypothetical protein